MLRRLFAPILQSIETRLSAACAVAALLIAVAGYQYGIIHRFHHWIPEGIEYENVKVAAALSDLVYGTNKGHVADMRVYDALRKGGLSIYPEFLDPFGIKFPANESDVDLINKALSDASNLGPLPAPKGLMVDLKPVEPNDLGMMDFYKWAFQLFGVKVQSFFKFYYLLHVASIALFILAYRRRLEAMTLMLIVVTGHFFALAFLSGGFPPEQIFGVATPYNQRFAAALGLLSAVHIVLAVIRPTPLRWDTLLPLTGQVVILCFVTTLRSSATWQLLWPASIGAGCMLLALLAHWKRVPRRFNVDAGDMIRRALAWPMVTLVVATVAFGAWSGSRTNALYRFSDEFLPNHMFWHSVYLGLAVHPKWNERFGQYLPRYGDEIPSGDQLAFAAAEQWLKDNYGLPQSYMLSPIRGWRYRTTERIIREVYIDFIRRNPGFALAVHFIYKPKLLVTSIAQWNARTAAAWHPGFYALFAAVLALIGACAVAVGRHTAVCLRPMAGALVLGTLWATVPSLLVFPSFPTMSDQVLMVDIMVVAGVFIAIAAVARRRHARSVAVKLERPMETVR